MKKVTFELHSKGKPRHNVILSVSSDKYLLIYIRTLTQLLFFFFFPEMTNASYSVEMPGTQNGHRKDGGPNFLILDLAKLAQHKWCGTGTRAQAHRSVG